MSTIKRVHSLRREVPSGEPFDVEIDYRTGGPGEHASVWVEPEDYFRISPAEVQLDEAPDGGTVTFRAVVVRRVFPDRPNPRECRLVARVDFVSESDFVEVQ
jgi:hypothetical protein